MQTNILFSIKTTDSAKGVALLLLLWHHLFSTHPEYSPLVFYTAHSAKVCVSIFLLLSGFGIAKSIQSTPSGLFSFYTKRFSHIYLNYWFIAVIFVPIGIFFFDRPISDAFKTYPYIKLIIQMTGYHMYFSEVGFGYNPTWWYISVILGMYWLFPFMFAMLKRYGAWALIPSLVILMIPQRTPFGISILYLWIFPFMLGIYFALNNGFEHISSKLKKLGRSRHLILMVLIVLLTLLRIQLSKVDVFHGQRIDGLFGTAIILLVFELTRQIVILESGLVFLGRHLFNIFLFHTFIFYYFFPKFIYSFNQPVVIFLTLLIICLGISIFLELIKKWIGFQKVQTVIDNIPIGNRYRIN